MREREITDQGSAIRRRAIGVSRQERQELALGGFRGELLAIRDQEAKSWAELVE